MGLVGLRGCRRERGGETSPCFPGAPVRKEEEDSQGCLGTVGAARVGAQGEGREFFKNSNKPDQSFGSGQGEQLPPGPSRFLTIWNRAKTPHFERHKPFNGVF